MCIIKSTDTGESISFTFQMQAAPPNWFLSTHESQVMMEPYFHDTHCKFYFGEHCCDCLRVIPLVCLISGNSMTICRSGYA